MGGSKNQEHRIERIGGPFREGYASGARARARAVPTSSTLSYQSAGTTHKETAKKGVGTKEAFSPGGLRGERENWQYFRDRQ